MHGFRATELGDDHLTRLFLFVVVVVVCLFVIVVVVLYYIGFVWSGFFRAG